MFVYINKRGRVVELDECEAARATVSIYWHKAGSGWHEHDKSGKWKLLSEDAADALGLPADAFMHPAGNLATAAVDSAKDPGLPDESMDPDVQFGKAAALQMKHRNLA